MVEMVVVTERRKRYEYIMGGGYGGEVVGKKGSVQRTVKVQQL
jgi:hypothetical protein